MFGKIVAAEVRLTLGVDVVCWEKVMLLACFMGVVIENEYDLPETPAGTVSTISLGVTDVSFSGRFLTPVVNANLL